MKHPLLALAVVLVLGTGGCATVEPAGGPPRVLVALHLAGGGAPSAQQVALVLRALAPVMASVGFQVADRTEQADYVLSATFTPDGVDANGGQISLQGFAPTRGNRGSTANPSASTLKEMQDRVANLERWALRGQIGR